MNEFTANNPSEMLNLLFDGELNSTMETELYASLLESEDLRNELRELITIREAVRKDTEAFTLPAIATQNIFSKLGYNPISSVAKSSNNIVTKPWYKKLWNPIVSAIVASLLTALFFLNTNNNINNSVNHKLAKSGINKTTNNTVLNKKMPVIKQNLINDKKTNPTHRTRIKAFANSNSVSSSNKNSSEKIYKSSLPVPNEKVISTQNSFSESRLSFNNPFSFSNVRDEKELSRIGNVREREFQLADNYYPQFNKEHSLTLSLNGISAVSFPNVNIESQSTILSNVSFGGFIPLSKNIDIGLEVGQETFGQVFYNMENNRAVKYKQNPKLLWAGMGINYTFDKYIIALSNAKPFVHFTLASTSLGPYGKAVTGIQFASDNGFGFNFGLEGSMLLYQNDNRFYTTSKLGFIYGMFMKF